MPGNVKEARVSLTPSEVVPIEHIFPLRGHAGYGPAILPMNLPQVSVQRPPLCMLLFSAFIRVRCAAAWKSNSASSGFMMNILKFNGDLRRANSMASAWHCIACRRSSLTGRGIRQARNHTRTRLHGIPCSAKFDTTTTTQYPRASSSATTVALSDALSPLTFSNQTRIGKSQAMSCMQTRRVLPVLPVPLAKQPW